MIEQAPSPMPPDLDALVRRAADHVIVAKRAPSRDFVAGVMAARNAVLGLLQQQAVPPPTGADQPALGMKVKCRSRAVTLTVLRWASGAERTEVHRRIRASRAQPSPNEGACDPDELALLVRVEGGAKGPRNRWMRLSTWRRWTKGGYIPTEASTSSSVGTR